MKKILLTVYSIISIVSFIILLNLYDIIEFNKLKNIEIGNNSHKIYIENSIDNIPADKTYETLTAILDKFDGNIIYTTTKFNGDDSIVVKYVYPENCNFIEELKLGREDNIKKGLKENYFLASFETDRENQIGLIYDFRDNDNIVVTTLKNAIENKSFSGECIVNISNQNDFNSFITELSKELNVNIESKPIYKDSSKIYVLVYVLVIILYMILSLIILYIVLNSYKKFAIKKMLGYTAKDIWIEDIRTLLTYQIIINLIINILMFIICINEYSYFLNDFIFKLGINMFINILLSFVFLSVPYMYINKISISNIIREKKNTKLIVYFNTAIKIFILSTFILLMSSCIKEYSSIKSFYQNSYEKWEETKDYVFLGGIKSESYDQFNSNTFSLKLKELYMFFNNMDSILADFSEFEEEFIKLNKDINIPEPIKSLATINPNYLLKNNIYDTDNKLINVSEKETDTILIVPQKYKKYEVELLDYFSYLNNKIKIIWSKDNQSIFSYNIEVNPKDGNNVIDPVIRVVTEKNGDLSEYTKVAGYNSNPFKINISGIDFNSVLKDKANELEIYENLVNIYSVYDNVAYDIYILNQKISVIIFISMICILIIIFMIFQNTSNYFDENRKLLTIKSFLGYKHIDKYKEYYVYLFYSWIFIIISLVFSSIIGFKINWSIFLISASIEILFSLLNLNKIEKLNFANTIKRG